MSERSITILRAVGDPNNARIIAHLAKHKGETAEDLGKHLGYPIPTVYKYLRELESVRMVESVAKGRVRLYYPSPFQLEVSPERLMQVFEGESLLDLYKARFGDARVKYLNEVVEKARAGEMTYRQAASTLGMPYYEFVLLLDETGADG